MVYDPATRSQPEAAPAHVEPDPPRRAPWMPPAPWPAGFLLIACSLGLFLIGGTLSNADSRRFGLFLLHHAITLGYLIALSFGAKHRDPELRLHCRYLLFVLGLISAYALNRELPVFDESAPWLCVALVTFCAAGIALPFLHRLPPLAKQVLIAVNAAALLLWTYLSLFLIPVYLISLVGLLAVGISLYTFVPLALLWLSGFRLLQELKNHPRLRIGFATGIAGALIPLIVFCSQWTTVNRSAGELTAIARTQDGALPEWALTAQRLPQNAATEAFLKGSFVYTGLNGLWDDWGMPSRDFTETRRHDPFVAIATFLSPPTALSREDRLRILDVRYDARHKTEERLWSGAHLRTGSVSTRARIWPAQRLAYQEQIITVRNTAPRDGFWNPDEEALFTFQLPEGSAVTSLSLWINGTEAPARLSSRGKADTAYRNIVGVERRDPSLVRWMEGNRVTVRVFPVPSGGERRFKIGVTTPVPMRDGRLRFEPLRFEGPDAADARMASRIQIEGDVAGLSGLDAFSNTAPGIFEYSGDFRQHALGMTAPKLQEAAFSFNGSTYRLSEASSRRAAFRPKQVYLDLNASWTRSEFNTVCEALRGYPVYAGAQELQLLSPATRDAFFTQLQKNTYSLFPFFLIPEPDNALIITKSTERGPNLADLSGSPFAERLGRAVSGGQQYRVFELEETPSSYIKSLRERRILRYESGSLDDLRGLIGSGRFAADPETPNSVVIGDAGLRITKTPGIEAAGGPDHLLRLYNYNDIIRHLGRNLYRNMESDSSLQRAADEAYVVSPVSSLIVLESIADYDRQGIAARSSAATSLGNAQIGNSGAVPEPHEWALIIIAICTLAWLKREAVFRKLKTARP